LATTFIIREPDTHRADTSPYQASDYLRFLLVFIVAAIAFIATFKLSAGIVSSSKDTLKELFNNQHLAGFIVATIRLAVAAAIAWFVAMGLVRAGVGNRQMITESYVDPVRDFFKRYGMGLALLLLALIGLYRVSDIVMGVIANVFYQEVGYTKVQIANVSKFFGLIMTIAGGLLGGFLSVRFGVMRILFLGAVLSAVTNLLFIVLAESSASVPMLVMVIIFSSLMTLFPKILGGYSGSIAESIGYTYFFTMTALLTLPVLLLIFVMRNRFNDKVVMKT